VFDQLSKWGTKKPLIRTLNNFSGEEEIMDTEQQQQQPNGEQWVVCL
jgi:hypothetical protein